MMSTTPEQTPLAYVLDLGPNDRLTCRVTPTECLTVSPRFLGVEHLLRFAVELRIRMIDRQLLMQLAMSTRIGSDVITLVGRMGFNIVNAMVEAGHCFWGLESAQPLKWAKALKATPDWLVAHDPASYIPVLLGLPTQVRAIPLAPPLYLNEDTRTCGPIQSPLPDAFAEIWAQPRSLDPAKAAQFCEALTTRFPNQAFPTPTQLKAEALTGVTPVPCLGIRCGTFQGKGKTLDPSGQVTMPYLRLEFDYQGRKISHHAPDRILSVLNGEQPLRIERNAEFERQAIQRLTALGLVPLADVLPSHHLGAAAHQWTLGPASPIDWHTLLSARIPEWQQSGWRIDTADKLVLRPIADQAWYTRLEAEGPDWFDFEAGIQVEGQPINLLPLIHRFLQQNAGRDSHAILEDLKRRATVSMPLPDGSLAVMPAQRWSVIIENLFELFGREPLQKNNRLSLNAWRAVELVDLERLSDQPWRLPKKFRRLADALRAGVSFKALPAPPGFHATLRPYQGQGLAWLQFLREHEINGVLADDMGLGKTVQTLAHLLGEKKAGRLKRPALVITPTSVVENWKEEASRFTPSLKTVVIHGSDRHEALEGLKHYDLAITSYALLRRDADLWASRRLSYVILDEAQFIKNRHAHVSQIACQLQSDHRLCLTGTPMENHLGELWSLFHFLMPGFLGHEKAFTEHVRAPIEKEGRSDVRQALNRRLAPFILRRTKAVVAGELPPKTEIMLPLELSDLQKDLYETVRAAMETRVRQEIDTAGMARSQIVILDALLKLRQICCDPRLLDKQRHFSIPADSCKIAALMDMLPEMVEEGRRILLFSQFTQMLALIEKALNPLSIKYIVLTGATRDRKTPIRQFQNGEVPVFLISLKAGGTGLNLTAADTVIHYDPWWNPAVEAQATDRAHRLGQDKPVFVYKWITQGTVEEKIMELQKRKKTLVSGILNDEPAEGLRFTEADLKHLLAPLG